jgi:hypothetical protein
VADLAIGSGTKADPWVLKTPPGTSEYHLYRDETADPPALVCQVGSTQVRYHLRAIDDLYAMLKAHRDWMPLGAADEQKPTPVLLLGARSPLSSARPNFMQPPRNRLARAIGLPAVHCRAARIQTVQVERRVRACQPP